MSQPILQTSKKIRISVPFFGAKELVVSGIFLFIDFTLEASLEASLGLVDLDKTTFGLCTES